jgi:hypothetical protein
MKTPFDLAADAEHVHLLTILRKDEDAAAAANGGDLSMEPLAAAAVAAAAVAARAAGSRSGSSGSNSSKVKQKGLVAGMTRLWSRHKGKPSVRQEPSELGVSWV